MALPTLTVLLDDGTGTYPYDITRYVMATDGYEVTRGRDDWIGAVTAGELSLTLNNSDGRFTPGSTILGSPSPIVVDQRIRIQETVTDPSLGGFGVGGFGLGGFGVSGSSSYARFTGYVKSWPVTWPATVTTFSEVHITATDAQARAERRTLRSMLEEEILSHSPTSYYTLAEATGATSAGDSSGSQAAALAIAGTGTAPTFGTGTGPGADGLAATQFFGGQYLRASITPGAFPSSFTLAAWFNTTTASTSSPAIIARGSGFYLAVGPTGLLVGFGQNTLTTSTTVTDGHTHSAVLTLSGGVQTLYLDGAVVASSSSGVPATPETFFTIGGSPSIPFNVEPFTGTISHVFTSSTALAAADVAAIYAAGTSSSESDTARMTRIAGYAGVPVGTLDSTLTNVTTGATTGQSAQQAIQDAADAALGLVYIDGSGSLTFHNRNRVPAKTAPDLTLSSQWVTPDVQPVVDDQRIVNYFEATAGTGSVQTVRGATSETNHGRYPTSQTYLVQTDQEALDRANWIVANFAEPGPRYGTLTINLYGMTAVQQATVLDALDLDCWLRVTSMASQNPGGTTTDVIVEGWHETVTASAWTISCNVVPRSLYSPVWLLDSSHLGVDTRLYV